MIYKDGVRKTNFIITDLKVALGLSLVKTLKINWT